MTIEKRSSKRVDFHNRVQVRYRDNRAFSAEAVDLGLDGMFLRATTLQICKSTVIDLEFNFAGRQWHISALVVHTSAKGFGVLFSNAQPELYEIARAIDVAHPSLFDRQRPQKRACQ